jgi:hypothetical protein
VTKLVIPPPIVMRPVCPAVEVEATDNAHTAAVRRPYDQPL